MVNMFYFVSLVAAMLIAQSSLGQTQESESKMTLEEAVSSAERGADPDELITNPKMRAESGSKSKWSFASSLAYSGGSIRTPFSSKRPNIARYTGTFPSSTVEGAVSAKYNQSQQSSWFAGVGVRWITPMNDQQTFDASNPNLTYQYLYAWRGIESAVQVGANYYTNKNLVDEGYVADLTISQNSATRIGQSGLWLGLYGYVAFGYFNKTGPLGTPGTEDYMEDVRADQADYSLGLSPFLEYQFNDWINFRTVSNIWNVQHLRSASSPGTFRVSKVNQSVGIGFAVTRDIFLYPNVQFLPDQISADLTNVGLSASINLF